MRKRTQPPAPEYGHPQEVPLLQAHSVYIGQVVRALRRAYPEAGPEDVSAVRFTYHERWLAQFAGLPRGAAVPDAVARSLAGVVGESEAVRTLRHTGADLAACVNWSARRREEAAP